MTTAASVSVLVLVLGLRLGSESGLWLHLGSGFGFGLGLGLESKMGGGCLDLASDESVFEVQPQHARALKATRDTRGFLRGRGTRVLGSEAADEWRIKRRIFLKNFF